MSAQVLSSLFLKVRCIPLTAQSALLVLWWRLTCQASSSPATVLRLLAAQTILTGLSPCWTLKAPSSTWEFFALAAALRFYSKPKQIWIIDTDKHIWAFKCIFTLETKGWSTLVVIREIFLDGSSFLMTVKNRHCNNRIFHLGHF